MAHAARSRFLVTFTAVVLAVGLLPAAAVAPGGSAVRAAHTANPTSVTLAGSLQSELGCAGDWDPGCASTHLVYDAGDDVWRASFSPGAGSFEYKAALNDSWTENYGLNAVPGGANIPLAATSDPVTFYYDHKSHWITDNVNSTIAVVPGSFQSELGCAGDWDPGCLRSWLQDSDENGIYEFETTALPAGNYEAKVALNESWDVNYGAGGVQNGPNIPFSVPGAGYIVRFTYDATSHVLTISVSAPVSQPDNNVEWDGVRHDSRDALYRAPGGAVPTGTNVTIRLRTFHNDVTAVKARFYSVVGAGQQIVPLELAATDVDCYQGGLGAKTCDFWSVTLPGEVVAHPDVLWYRFVVTDGSDTDYYDDDTAALDGGLGAPTDEVEDNSWAVSIYDPAFQSPDWARHAVIYQIFPDRFRNGRKDNDPKTGDVRYDDPVIKLAWGVGPEGYCRNYANASDPGVCPWRFDDTPPDWSPTKEAPRGRDYFGGDLKGVDQQLNYLAALGVTTIYFNPIFDAGSNHSYDTQDYTKVDPYFGTDKDWRNLVKHADDRGIRIVLDGVFNHLSSDSALFDRYHHYPATGACEAADSPWRGWFTFRAPAGSEPTPCVPSAPGGADTYYDGWFGFDSIPVITKTLAAVESYFLTNADSIARRWLRAGASGWRMDVSGDPSFPGDYWPTFRSVVKGEDPDALTISETWQKDSTLLRMLLGDRLDTTMNYRLRDAVIGLLAAGPFDSKGFADSGRIIAPSEFANRLASIREDYADPAYYSLMNLLDSHDTERLLWTLTPGSETTADKESNAANVAIGKTRVRLASLIQFGVPGAPTVYYGDEVGMTGDDDPDDRRTYPWADLGGSPDAALRAHYTTVASLRASIPALTVGDLRILVADDATGVVAFGRKTGSSAAIVAVNRSDSPRTFQVPLAGYVPNGIAFVERYEVGAAGGSLTVTGGTIEVNLPAMGGVLLATGTVDLAPPGAPTGLTTAEGNGEVALDWNPVAGAAGYNVYRSPVTGGGYVRLNGSPLGGPGFTDTGVENGRTYFYVVTALDGTGNESGYSNEASALPHYAIGWANLQWPPTMAHAISAVDRTDTAYGQVWIDGATSLPGATPGLRAQLGFGPDGSSPAGNPAWTWVEAAFNLDVGNNDEFMASLLPETVGSFGYVYRYSTTNGRDWIYADLSGPFAGAPPNPGALTVVSSGDTTPPDAPTDLAVVSQSPAGIELGWDAVLGDLTLYGYEVLRGDSSGGPYATLVLLTGTSYTDTNVVQDDTYYYVVRAVDLSFNRSGHSNEVSGTAELRTVTLTFNVTVPASTDGTGRSVYVAGTLSRLDGGLPDWNPGATVMARVDATHWSITLTGRESTQIEYKYTLGDWDHVEKDGACGEIANRLLTLSYGSTGTQIVNDTVPNWRNVAPCGN